MRLKSLVKKFGFNELIDVSKKEGWQIPTLEQLKSLPYDYEDNDVWVDIQHQNDDYGYVYNKKKHTVTLANKMFMEYAVVIVNDKCCNSCKHFDNQINNCMRLQLIIDEPSEFYCAYFTEAT